MHIIGGQFKKAKLVSPKGDQTRPTKNIFRETFFNICAPYIEGAIFVDLFAGSGAMGLEALSRGAEHVFFVEKHKYACMAIEKNIAALKVQEHTTLLKGDVLQMLCKIDRKCDLIFADPPYQKDEKDSHAVDLLNFFENHVLLKSGGFLFLEVGEKEKRDWSLFPSFKYIKSRSIGSSQLIQLKSN